jgi:hypothetical protein
MEINMQSQTLSFSKVEKSITKIDNDLNAILEKVTFKFATQNQSAIKGKMVVTLFYEEKPGKIRAKAFKDQSHKNLDTHVNEFISDKKVQFVTQTFIGSSIYTIVYYVIGKTEDDVNQ